MKIKSSIFSACSECTAGQVAIGAADPETGAQEFNPMAPVAGQDANGCATLTYMCTGFAANVGVRKLSCSEV